MSRRYEYDSYYPRYVSAAERKQKAQAKIKKLTNKGVELSPVEIEGRNIAKTFWGKAWCTNIESYRDYENRLPRGRSYVRQGAVIDLKIQKGTIIAQVSGSELYEIVICISELPAKKWQRIKELCAGKINSLISLIQGKLSPEIIEILCRKDEGLFPSPKEIKMNCNCPDWADLCKHLAAVLYGVGARLDEHPELFFLLRGVDQNELFDSGLSNDLADSNATSSINENDLSNIFGIELDNLDSDDIEFLDKPAKKTTKKSVKAKKAVKSTKNTKSPVTKTAKSEKTVKPAIKTKPTTVKITKTTKAPKTTPVKTTKTAKSTPVKTTKAAKPLKSPAKRSTS